MAAPRKMTDQQFLDLWADPNNGTTRIAKILGVDLSTVRKRADRLVGSDAREERRVSLIRASAERNKKTFNPSQGAASTKKRHPNNSQKPHRLTRWYKESDEHYNTRVRASRARDPKEIQQNLRESSKIVQRILGDPDAPDPRT